MTSTVASPVRTGDEDVQEVPEYSDTIFEYLMQTECQFLPREGYMMIQTDVNEKMRAILIDWLVEVQIKFMLLPETLYLTTNLIDRYLGLEKVTKDKLQLVGVACMLIATKYEEIYAPEVKDFVYISDNAYTA